MASTILQSIVIMQSFMTITFPLITNIVNNKIWLNRKKKTVESMTITVACMTVTVASMTVTMACMTVTVTSIRRYGQ